jgi:hypothetical protein
MRTALISRSSKAFCHCASSKLSVAPGGGPPELVKEVDAAEVVDGFLMPMFDGLGGGDVGGDGQHLGSGLFFDFASGCGNGRCVPRGDGNLRAFFGQGAGNRIAQAAAGAGDHGDFVGQT